MISVEQAKRIMDDPTLSDREIEEIRDALYVFAEIAIDIVITKKKSLEKLIV